MAVEAGDGDVGGRCRQDDGSSLVEILLVLVAMVMLAGMAAPAVTRMVDAMRGRHAAGFVAARLREARQHAVLRGQAVALLFESGPDDGWRFRSCEDGNGNGVRRADVDAGIDSCADEPIVLARALPQSRLAVLAGIPGPGEGPAGDDPVRFGASDMASFSPEGTCTAGTVFVQSVGGVQFAVRVAGATGRTRILRYEPGSRRWHSG